MKNKIKLLTKSGIALLTAMTFMGAAKPLAQTYYTVQPGDTFYHIAQRYGLDYHYLMALNGRSSSYLDVGDQILIQAGSQGEGEAVNPPSDNGPVNSSGYYRVQAGDTLYDIARAYGMSVDYLMALNGITSTYIHVGDVLAVNQTTAPAPQPPTSSNGTAHLVQPGDNLSSIAFTYGVTVAQLRAWNGLVTDLIYPGDRISIVEGGTSSITPNPTSPSQSPRGNDSTSAGSHSIAPGETLYDIARAYGLSYEQLMAYNGLSSTMIYPGQILYLPTSNGYTPTPNPSQSTNPSQGQSPSQTSEPNETTTQPSSQTSEPTETTTQASSQASQETTSESSDSESRPSDKKKNENKVTRLRIPQTATKKKKDLADPQTKALDPESIDLVTHEVVEGETLEEIVAEYDASMDDVRTWNKLLNTEVQAGDILYLSDPSQAVTRYGQVRPLKDAYPVHYLVKRTDDLDGLADLFNVKPGWIRQWSELEDEEAIEPGQELVVTHPQAKPDLYTVEAEDSLESIAEAHQVSVEAIREWNGLLDNVIYIGEELAVSNPMPTYHQVQPGETLEVIAEEYDLSIDQLREWNKLPAETMIVNGLLIVSDPKVYEGEEEKAAESEADTASDMEEAAEETSEDTDETTEATEAAE